ncbi:hypothetical protein QVD17_41576 [Tagetes erecta]|uniref:Uncharacterized protein n=1 Tax=Tagetes erecta TaxID=13708 RepID=A0AAD8JM32_TARER|nr:hypothetical protein QVD17_41576 [Tagetes erecta]
MYGYAPARVQMMHIGLRRFKKEVQQKKKQNRRFKKEVQQKKKQKKKQKVMDDTCEVHVKWDNVFIKEGSD